MTLSRPPVSPASAVEPEPESRCIRCGRPVPADVSLCEADNPGRVGSPSATQAHGTILIGVIVGFALFALAARFAVSGGSDGPFAASVEGRAGAGADVAIVIRVANDGATDAPADCRVTRDGTSRPTDTSFRTPSIPAGGSIVIERRIPIESQNGPDYDPARLTVSCA